MSRTVSPAIAVLSSLRDALARVLVDSERRGPLGSVELDESAEVDA